MPFNHPEIDGSISDLQVLDPHILRVWRIKTGLWLAFPVIVALVYDIFQFFDSEKALPFGVLPGVVLVAMAAITVWLPGLRYRSWKYALRSDELVLIRGVFNRVHSIVPLRRIQHLDVSQDIFEREYELGKLIVHTAGTRDSSVALPGLRLEVAERLRDEMKQVITDEAL